MYVIVFCWLYVASPLCHGMSCLHSAGLRVHRLIRVISGCGAQLAAMFEYLASAFGGCARCNCVGVCARRTVCVGGLDANVHENVSQGATCQGVRGWPVPEGLCKIRRGVPMLVSCCMMSAGKDESHCVITQLPFLDARRFHPTTQARTSTCTIDTQALSQPAPLPTTPEHTLGSQHSTQWAANTRSHADAATCAPTTTATAAGGATGHTPRIVHRHMCSCCRHKTPQHRMLCAQHMHAMPEAPGGCALMERTSQTLQTQSAEGDKDSWLAKSKCFHVVC